MQAQVRLLKQNEREKARRSGRQAKKTKVSANPRSPHALNPLFPPESLTTLNTTRLILPSTLLGPRALCSQRPRRLPQ